MAMVANVSLLLAVLTNGSMANSYTVFAKASGRSTRYYLPTHPLAFAPTFPSTNTTPARPRARCSLAATAPTEEREGPAADATIKWRARRDGWRPTVNDVERISWGLPASKKGKRTGSRGVPHRLNDDERRAFDQARRQGFLQARGSAWRSQRRDAPLLNSYRSLMDARGRPVTVLHKLGPTAAGGADDGDRLVVDLSPLRLPGEFERVGRELTEKISSEFGVRSLVSDEEKMDAMEEDTTTADINAPDDEGEDWGTRPIYQMPPYILSWAVSRQQGKQMGKFLAIAFDSVEEKAIGSKKPKGVKPGKGRRHGGYGIG